MSKTRAKSFFESNLRQTPSVLLGPTSTLGCFWWFVFFTELIFITGEERYVTARQLRWCLQGNPDERRQRRRHQGPSSPQSAERLPRFVPRGRIRSSRRRPAEPPRDEPRRDRPRTASSRAEGARRRQWDYAAAPA